MTIEQLLLNLLTPQKIHASDDSELIVGSLFDDVINAKGGNDIVFGLSGDDTMNGGDGQDEIFGGFGDDKINGGNDEDLLLGEFGNDIIAGNKGNDFMFGGFGNDKLVWNNGDGSDLMVGGQGYDQVQVNFNTDLVNNKLANKDVAEFSTTPDGVQFARIEVNDQTEVGLFQLDIRQTEKLETNFGRGDDTAKIVGNVLEEIKLNLNGGAGVDLLDLSQADGPIDVNLGSNALGSSVAKNFENVIGTEFSDEIVGNGKDNVISGLGGVDTIMGRGGDDTLIANKGDDFVFAGNGDDLMVWNNGDGSDLFNGGRGEDTVQVNFDTDLVNDDLQNKDVAEFSTTKQGVQFARIEVNDQTEVGLFQLDIRKTENLETNFGGGDDTAVIVDDVINEILLNLDGGEGVDTLDFSQSKFGVIVDLEAGIIGEGTAKNFENVIGSKENDILFGNDQDNIIAGGGGADFLKGGDGSDIFVFSGVDAVSDAVILDFVIGDDKIGFATTDPSVTAESVLDALTQVDEDVELVVNDNTITFEGVQVGDFTTDDFLII